MTHHDDIEDHDRGLGFDLPKLVGRRGALAMLGGAGLAMLGGGTAEATTAKKTPEETAGPYPGDGSNGVNVLTQSGIVRRDITSSFGSASATAVGVPLTIKLKILRLKSGKTSAYRGAAVYLWHCNRDGKYSLYDTSIKTENYLRGVQVANKYGNVYFDSIFPACYSGRWPHIHFEVYSNLTHATSSTDKVRTSQLALPKSECERVYATTGYEASVQNLTQTSLSTDNVFSDGYSLELGKITGSMAKKNLRVALNVVV